MSSRPTAISTATEEFEGIVVSAQREERRDQGNYVGTNLVRRRDHRSGALKTATRAPASRSAPHRRWRRHRRRRRRRDREQAQRHQRQRGRRRGDQRRRRRTASRATTSARTRPAPPRCPTASACCVYAADDNIDRRHDAPASRNVISGNSERACGSRRRPDEQHREAQRRQGNYIGTDVSGPSRCQRLRRDIIGATKRVGGEEGWQRDIGNKREAAIRTSRAQKTRSGNTWTGRRPRWATRARITLLGASTATYRLQQHRARRRASGAGASR